MNWTTVICALSFICHIAQRGCEGVTLQSETVVT